jgi:hypothetical protein
MLGGKLNPYSNVRISAEFAYFHYQLIENLDFKVFQKKFPSSFKASGEK